MNEINFLFIPKRKVEQEWEKNGRRRRGTKKERKVSSYYESKGYSFVKKTTKTMRIPEEFRNEELESTLSDRAGLPDLLALDAEKPTKFIEVKGPSKWLSNDQIDWIITHAESFPIEVALMGRFRGTVKFSSSFEGNLSGYLEEDIMELIEKKKRLIEEVKELKESINKMKEEQKELKLSKNINRAIDELETIRSKLND